MKKQQGKTYTFNEEGEARGKRYDYSWHVAWAEKPALLSIVLDDYPRSGVVRMTCRREVDQKR